jgi:hypothetical protein
VFAPLQVTFADHARMVRHGRSSSKSFATQHCRPLGTLSNDRGYYRCMGRYNGGIEDRCSMSRTVRAEKAKTLVWEFVSEILSNPHRLAQGLEKMLENERQLSTGEGETLWLKRIAEIDLKRERLLDLHPGGDITTEQFRIKSAKLAEARAATEGQLEAARSHLIPVPVIYFRT